MTSIRILVLTAILCSSYSALASASDVLLPAGGSITISGINVTCEGNSSGNSSDNCVWRLSVITGWDTDSLKRACTGAGADCVVSLAIQSTEWNPYSLNYACYGDYNNCVGRLAAIRTGWGTDTLKRACRGDKADCVVSSAKQNPDWGSDTLYNACKN